MQLHQPTKEFCRTQTDRQTTDFTYCPEFCGSSTNEMTTAMAAFADDQKGQLVLLYSTVWKHVVQKKWCR